MNIALCDATGPIFGVVADPLANRMYLGGMGVPVQVTPLDGSTVKPLHPSPIQRPYRLVTSWVEEARLQDLVPPHIDPADVVSRPVSGGLSRASVEVQLRELARPRASLLKGLNGHRRQR